MAREGVMRNRMIEPAEQRDWNDAVAEALNDLVKEQRKTNRLLTQLVNGIQFGEGDGNVTGQPDVTLETPQMPADAVGAVTTETVTTTPAANPTEGQPMADETGGLAAETEQPSGDPKSEQTGGQADPATQPDPGLPWEGYDGMNVEEVLAKAKTVDDATRQRALAYEQKRAKRAGVIRPLVNWNS